MIVYHKGGIIILTTPQRVPIHAAPCDYYRYTRYGPAYIAGKAGFEIKHISVRGGLFLFMIYFANEALYSLAGEQALCCVKCFVLKTFL